MRFKKSPIFYMGNKYKLLRYLIPLFPKTCTIFVDLFGGGGTVSMNYKGTSKTIYNDFNENIVELIKMVVNNSSSELNDYWNSQIKKYNLKTKSCKIRQTFEEESKKFLQLREDYNKSEKKDYKDLYLLSCYSINHLIRFNSNNEFNVCNGSDAYNENNYRDVIAMNKTFKDVEIRCSDALKFNLDEIDKNSFIYCDPPYLNTNAVYNEERAFGGWDIECDYKLFNMLEEANKRGIKWGLSNVFENRGIANNHLINWCEKNNWHVHHLYRNYHPFSRTGSESDEVFICNYKENDIAKKVELW